MRFLCVPWQFFFCCCCWMSLVLFEAIGCKPLLSLTEQPRFNVSHSLCINPSQFMRLGWTLFDVLLFCCCDSKIWIFVDALSFFSFFFALFGWAFALCCAPSFVSSLCVVVKMGYLCWPHFSSSTTEYLSGWLTIRQTPAFRQPVCKAVESPEHF